MISCSEAVQQLWDYLENEVAEADRAAIEQHLAFCRRCCDEVEFAEELQSVLASAAEIELPRAVERRLTSALDGLDSERSQAQATDHGGTA